MAMTGRTVADGMILEIIFMGAATLPSGGTRDELLRRAQATVRVSGAPLVPVFPQQLGEETMLNVAHLRIRVPRGSEQEVPKSFRLNLSWLSSRADAFIPEEVLEAIDWTAHASQHAVPLDEGQRSSGRHRSPGAPPG